MRAPLTETVSPPLSMNTSPFTPVRSTEEILIAPKTEIRGLLRSMDELLTVTSMGLPRGGVHIEPSSIKGIASVNNPK